MEKVGRRSYKELLWPYGICIEPVFYEQLSRKYAITHMLCFVQSEEHFFSAQSFRTPLNGHFRWAHSHDAGAWSVANRGDFRPTVRCVPIRRQYDNLAQRNCSWLHTWPFHIMRHVAIVPFVSRYRDDVSAVRIECGRRRTWCRFSGLEWSPRGIYVVWDGSGIRSAAQSLGAGKFKWAERNKCAG